VPTEMTRAGVGGVLALVVLACALGARADGSDHKYKDGDHVPLYANKVGPFHNPRYWLCSNVQTLFFRGL
jgi:hypothetical protein